MGVLALLRLALVSISAIIGCRSFTIGSSSNSLYGFSHCRHHRRHRSLVSSPATPKTFILSAERSTTVKLLSNTNVADEGDGLFVSARENTDSISPDDEKENAFGLYIHIPYCRQRCRYCDFAIVPIGDHGSTKNERSNALRSGGSEEESRAHQTRREQGFRRMNDRYISAIIAELKQIAERNMNTSMEGRKVPLRSIYFGGGTPSLAPIESIESILYHACGSDNSEAPFCLLQQSQAFNETEITMEMDPGTFDREYLSSLRDLGINRVSLGVQSFDDNILRAMGRTHRRDDVLQAVRDIASVFGKNTGDSSMDEKVWENVNYSIDLISGCPGLTPAKWVETLQEATVGVDTKETMDSSSPTMKERGPFLLSSLPPPKHISVYDMQIEEGTVFGKWAAEAEEAVSAKMKKEEQSYSTYENGDDADEDPSRQFTVALPINENGESGGRVSSGLNLIDVPSKQQQILRLPSEDECAFMYKYAAGYLRSKNYEHYEVSSYAAFNDPGKLKAKRDYNGGGNQEKLSKPVTRRSKHNQIYWEYDGQWFAVGLGATSFVEKTLVARPRQMNDYIEWVDDNKYLASAHIEPRDKEDDSIDEDFLSDLLLKRLRTIDGLDLRWLEINYGSEIVEKVLEGAKLGLDLELAEHIDDEILRLKDPEG